MFSLLLSFLLLACACRSDSQDPIADTEYGQVRGSVLETLKGKRFLAFRGIPYAAPPVGPLRFKEPQPPAKFKGIFSATKDATDCVQHDVFFNSLPLNEKNFGKVIGSEDCLYLNIYTPKLDPEKPLPVMFWIHGGAFVLGTGSSILYGPEILMNKDIVLVSINYRLGPLGFLSLGNDELPGNNGLKDQRAALEWVQRNIRNFGGDPDSVTIFGESAGGASVHLHMKSTKSKGLFLRGISQSGNAASSWSRSTSDKARAIGLEFAQIVGCSNDNGIIECLREKTIAELYNALIIVQHGVMPEKLALGPVIEKESEGAFLTEYSIQNAPSIPWLTGVNSNEGLLVYDQITMIGDKDLKKFDKNHKQLLPRLLKYDMMNIKNDPDTITNKLKAFYVGEKTFSSNLQGAIDMFSDSLFLYPHYVGAKEHKGDKYLYYFAHRAERTFSVLAGNTHMEGVNHGDECFSIFHSKKFFPSTEYNTLDSKISDLLVNYWTNFATYGQPTVAEDGVQWTKAVDVDYLEISSNGIQMKHEYFPKRMKFWDVLLKEMKSDTTEHTEL